MDLFRSPGGNLIGLDKIQFDEIKDQVDRATNDFLLRPDWETNMRIVDLISSASTQNTINEVLFLLRKKIQSSSPKVVYLALSLIETLVKNCGPRVHAAVNDPSFLKEIGKVAKKYNSKSGSENIDVANQSLDMIQAWAEAFHPLQSVYPNIPKLYHELRKEGVRFNTLFDRTRVPIFSPPPSVAQTNSTRGPSAPASVPSFGGYDFEDDTNDDDMLAAALAASLKDVKVNSTPAPEASRRPQPAATPTMLSNTSNSTVEAVKSSIAILRELIMEAKSIREVAENEIAGDVFSEANVLMVKLASVIEEELMKNPEGLDVLFKTNDDAQATLSVYQSLRNKSSSLENAKTALTRIFGSTMAQAAPVKADKDTVNILDFDTPLAQTAPTPTMGLFSMTHGDISPSALSSSKGPAAFAKPVTVQHAPAARPIAAGSPVDDPFGPSSGIDALLSSPTPASAILPNPPMAQQSRPLRPQSDPLDSLLSIATRKDDFDIFSAPAAPPAYPIQLAAPTLHGNSPYEQPRFGPRSFPVQTQAQSAVIYGKSASPYVQAFNVAPTQRDVNFSTIDSTPISQIPYADRIAYASESTPGPRSGMEEPRWAAVQAVQPASDNRGNFQSPVRPDGSSNVQHNVNSANPFDLF